MSLVSVGGDGGIRLGSECFLSGESQVCPIDTGGGVSVIALSERNRHYPSLGQANLSSVGLELKCELVKVPDLQILGVQAPGAIFHRCENIPGETVLVGLNFFQERTFTIDFARKQFDLDTSYAGETSELYPGWLFSPFEKLIVMGKVSSEPVMIAVDTGAPVTLMDQKLVDRHPEIFVESKKPPSEMMKRRGFRRFEMHGPFVINGVELKAEFVHTADIFTFSRGTYLVILGVNHMSGANWFFDLVHKRWAIF